LTSTLDSLDSRIATFQRQLGKENTPEWDDIVWKIVMAGAVMLIVHFFLRFLGWILGSAAERNAVRRLWFKKWFPIVRLGFWSITIYIVVGAVFSFDRDSLILAGGTIGVAIGFAAQDVIKNIFGGILIILDQPFQVGDRVRVGGTYGEVVSIGLRSTRIVTPDDNLVTVPNTQVVDGQVANANSGALDCQVVTELFLPGWVDVSRAKQIAHSAAATSRYVYLNKPIVVLIKDEFEHAFLTKVIVKAYVLDARFENLFASDVTERAKVQFLEEGLLEPMYLTPFGEIHRAEREPGDSDSGKDDQQEGHDE
jgi:small-conductance mechanosensitive channel